LVVAFKALVGVVWKVQVVMQVVMMEVVDLEPVMQPSTPGKGHGC
jgi:hypothetical protein